MAKIDGLIDQSSSFMTSCLYMKKVIGSVSLDRRNDTCFLRVRGAPQVFIKKRLFLVFKILNEVSSIHFFT